MKEPKEYLDLFLVKPIDASINALENVQKEIEGVGKNIPNTLQMFPQYLNSLSDLRNKINSINFEVSSETLSSFVTNLMVTEVADAQDLFSDKTDEFIKRLNDLYSKINEENLAYNQELYNSCDVENEIFIELKNKHEVLLGYSDNITNLCMRYGITSSDININENTLTTNKLNKLYDHYIDYLRNTKEDINPITILKNKVPNVRMQGLIVLILIVLCFTPILSLVSILSVVSAIYCIKTQAKKAKYFGILQALIYNINPDRLEHACVDESLLLPTDINQDNIDNFFKEYPDKDTGELSKIMDEFDTMCERFDPENTVEKEHVKFRNAYDLIRPEINSISTEGKNKFDHKKNYVNKLLDEVIRTAEAEYQKLKDEYVGFGDKFIEDGVFDSKLTLGFNNYIEEYVDIGEKNVIIRPGSDSKFLTSFIRCMFVNAITHVNYMKMKVHVLDPNKIGEDIMPFYKQDLDSRIKIIQNGTGDVIKEHVDLAQKNAQLMQGLSISEYNKECEATNRDTIPYSLLFILSQPKEVEETEHLNSLFENSAKYGVMIWMVSENMPATSDTHLFIEPFAGVQHPIKFQDDRKWCNKVADNYIKAIDSYKPPSLSWDKFMEVACPPEAQWTFNADDNMYLYPGFQNGDPELCKAYPLGNGGNVHAIGVGTTGAGKSIFIHHIIQTMCEMYSPRELQLWMCDFKGTEFKFYMANEEFPYSLPHIKACLCTSDGDYATSVFHALRVITDRRFEQMKNPNEHRDWLVYDDGEFIPNFDNSKNWNIYWRERAKQTEDIRYIDNCYPRVFLVSDEFQVIFQTSSPKNLEMITADMTQISKLGRAASVHMFFTSQSMKGTLSADILNQFSLRFALRCTSDVSNDIMGTPYAAENLPKFGGLYVSATGIKKEDQPKFSTPFIGTETIHESTKKLAIRAKEENMPVNHLITYEEATKHPIDELNEFYGKLERQGKLPDNATLMVMGERMAYSENKAPDNFIVAKKNNENIMAVFSDNTDFVMFFNTIIRNLELNTEESLVVINSQVEDLSYIIDAESAITNKEMHLDLLRVSCAEMVKWLQGLLNSRAKSGKDSPVWVFLIGWDKGTGVGVDPDFDLRSRINSLLAQLGVYHIHIVMLSASAQGISPSTIAAFKYRICGKCSLDDSTSVIETKQASMGYEMATGWMFIRRDNDITRDKLYISEVTREITAAEIIIK